MKVSNKYTFLRMILAPVWFALFYIPELFKFKTGSVANIVFSVVLIAMLGFMEFTDFLDGYFARKKNEVSDFGKLFDPFADVILHMTTFATFTTFRFMDKSLCPLVIFILVFYREFSMNFLRMVAAKQGTAIAAKKGGKLKTVMYVVAGFFSLVIVSASRCGLVELWNLPVEVLRYVGYGIYGFCALLSYISFIDYLISFKSVLKAVAE